MTSSTARIAFLLEGMTRVGNGIVVSAIRRAGLFSDKLGIAPWIITSNFDPNLLEYVAELKSTGALPPDTQVCNVYHWLAEMAGEGAVKPLARAFAQDIGNLTLVTSEDAAGLRKHSYVDAADKPQTWREEFVFNDRIFLRKLFKEGKTGLQLNAIHMRGANGALREFRSESEWACHVVGMNLQADIPWHFVVDKNRRFAHLAGTPAIQTLCKTITAMLHNTHVLPSGKYRSDYRHLIENPGCVDRLITLTQEQYRELLSQGYPEERLRVIPHALRPPPAGSEPPQRAAKRAIFLSRYAPVKQHEMLIRIFQRVLLQVPDAELHTYGTGPLKEKLAKQVRKLGLQERIKINGFVEDIETVYATATLGVLPSATEGFSLFVLECLAHGCPTVSFAVKYGPRDLLENQGAGILIEPNNEEAMAQTLIDLFRHPEKIEAMRPHAIRSASRFTPEIVIDLWKAWWIDMQAIVAQRRKAPS